MLAESIAGAPMRILAKVVSCKLASLPQETPELRKIVSTIVDGISSLESRDQRCVVSNIEQVAER